MFCRIRLLSVAEGSSKDHRDLSYAIMDQGQSLQLKNNKKLLYRFKKLFGSNGEQAKIWHLAQKIIEDTIEGRQCVILAYGQTASGKTFTIQGTDKEPGIILRAIEYLPQAIERVREEGN